MHTASPVYRCSTQLVNCTYDQTRCTTDQFISYAAFDELHSICSIMQRTCNRVRVKVRIRVRARVSFRVRVVSDWNQLPAVVVEQETPAAFKAQLGRSVPVAWHNSPVRVIRPPAPTLNPPAAFLFTLLPVT